MMTMKYLLLQLLILSNLLSVTFSLFENENDLVQNLSAMSFKDFETEIVLSESIWVIQYFAPWDDECQTFAPIYEKIARMFKGIVKFGAIDATDELNTVVTMQGSSINNNYPALKFFGADRKNLGETVEYTDPQTLITSVMKELQTVIQERSSIKAYDEDDGDVEANASGVNPKEVVEIINEATFAELCKGQDQICIIAALPHILDSKADGRNKYKEMLSSASKAVAGFDFSFGWFEGGSQPELENRLELTFGFPGLVAVSIDRKVFTMCRTSFSVTNLEKYLTSLTTGSQQSFRLTEVPQILSVEPWNGKDGVAYEEEPLDDDWMNDESKLDL